MSCVSVRIKPTRDGSDPKSRKQKDTDAHFYGGNDAGRRKCSYRSEFGDTSYKGNMTSSQNYMETLFAYSHTYLIDET